jgi:hypothetical protein
LSCNWARGAQNRGGDRRNTEIFYREFSLLRELAAASVLHAPLAASGLVLVVLCVGCGQSGHPTCPTSSAAYPKHAKRRDCKGSTAVPFIGRLEGEGVPPVFEPPPSLFFSAHLVVEGNATLLGRFTLDFSHRVNLNTLVGIDAVFTTANGDTLLTQVEGPVTPAESPTAFTLVETYTVAGGTGRFESASGSLVITRAVDFANPFTSGSIEGSISAPSPSSEGGRSGRLARAASARPRPR